ncbi:type I restriction-modification system subunit M [Xanthomonas graminis]|uniref:site-specific DNA-methyltransferase (adenine-specific) n=1 Tax=Xanthomonas graminis pv. phlei TaxID=487906 RepID=A0A0K2ZX47_9XANT|nr:N-6 DNA methylase [Xanthomonas translucens]UKE66688.1 N-6 DNA methylase [Xanthomonas translucens pv. phlei]CTP90233.1 type I restriction-modification system specificity subunit [Xanthomonas translucens pv. phlei]
MTSTEQNIERFLATLQSLGGSAGNGKLREELGWQENTYLRIKQVLIEQGDIVSGRGRGGSVALAETAEVGKRPVSHLVSQQAKAVKPGALSTKTKAAKTQADTETASSVRRSGVVKKSDLYSSIWASCDELRGGMDASQYKDYVLFMLFIKYISDKYGNSDDFAPPVVIPPGASFKDMVALKGRADIGDKINTQVIQKLIESNTKLARSDFPDFNDPNKLGEGAAMVERLGNLIAIFEKPELNFANNRADNDDLLGDAYEYLMRHFAQDSGKSKGQFYTPSEVSSIIAQVIGISRANTRASTTAYDPTCGSGSLLLKVAAEAGRQITLEGQEKDVTTAGIARMNMILHHFPSATILGGDTLSNPKFKDGEQLRSYDYVVANPPFSDKKWSTGLTPASDPYQRFAWGAPPDKQGDYAYLLHVIRSMKATAGKGAIILPHGVLFRGNAEGLIRRQLVRSGMLKGIIGLPANLFFGTGIPACILVLDKENASARKGIFMIDASKGFIKDGPKNRLREQDIHRIVDAFRRGVDVPRYARMVPLDEIASDNNNYNLNLPRYIDSSEPEDLHDIDAHLNGGIPERDIGAFAADWEEMPALRQALFEAERPGYARLRQPIAEVRPVILAHPQFQRFRSKVETLFGKWQQAVTPLFTGIQPGDKPKVLITQAAETLLATFHAAPLLDPYDIYQHLMDYWAEVMQDDAYLIVADGWVALPRRIVEIDKKGKAKDKGWICDLLPKSYIVARYFATEQAELEAKQAELDSVASQLAELQEEHSGEDGAFAGFDKINAAQVKDRIAEIGDDADIADERAVLQQWQQLSAREAALKKTVKTLEEELDQQACEQYASLGEAEVKTLVVQDKWLAHLQVEVQQELDRISQTLAQRIRELAERYDTPLPKLEDEVAALSVRVETHLKRMGAVWK